MQAQSPWSDRPEVVFSPGVVWVPAPPVRRDYTATQHNSPLPLHDAWTVAGCAPKGHGSLMYPADWEAAVLDCGCLEGSHALNLAGWRHA